jgi:hypothetical protein
MQHTRDEAVAEAESADSGGRIEDEAVAVAPK